MTKELTAQEAKDLAYKYKDDLEIYTIAKNLEDALDGTRESEESDTRRLEGEISDLEDSNAELEREKSNLEDDVERLEKKVEALQDAAVAYIENPSDENKSELEELL